MKRSVLIALLAATSAAGGVACDFSDVTAPAATAACETIGAQCQLDGGPLGVCIEIPCTGDQTPPCFACTPQH